MITHKKTPRGFTLIELLVVIAILGILSAIVLVAVNPARQIGQAKDAQIKNDIGQITSAMQAYYTNNQYYPKQISDLVSIGELQNEPLTSDGGHYIVTTYPTDCTNTNGNNCTAVTVSALLSVPTTPGAYWQWNSRINRIQESTTLAP